ncbi:hypothetical protein [Pusillimonas sp. ANT_WB101]|nr:hypothetical protein [Pusillimonas sp. ANT_WB101]
MTDKKYMASHRLIVAILVVFWLCVYTGVIMFGATEFPPAVVATTSK